MAMMMPIMRFHTFFSSPATVLLATNIKELKEGNKWNHNNVKHFSKDFPIRVI